MKRDFKKWMRSGQPWVWLNAAAVGASLIMVIGLLVLIAIRGMGHFWPGQVHELTFTSKQGKQLRLIGEIYEREDVTAARMREAGLKVPAGVKTIERMLLKTGNRDVYGTDFRWILTASVSKDRQPADLVVLERHEWGNFYGYLLQVKQQGKVVAEGDMAWKALQARLDRVTGLYDRIKHIEKVEIGAINYEIERLRLRGRQLEIDRNTDPQARKEIAAERKLLQAKFTVLQKQLVKLNRQISRDSIVLEVMDGRKVEMPLAKVVRAFRPNAMSVWGKIGHYFSKLWEFVSDDPREANTEGGIYPAIFGTVTMVILMAFLVTPFGVVAAIYLHEYARQGFITRMIRIAVNNLAGVPSIVYGVFGLGFFVYLVGGVIDNLWFEAAKPAPTFKTPGLMWASLTLALMTVPVVIVATEEGLSRIPRAIREGSLALGATKWETLWKTVLPMASPAMMTGLILAVARAAGEVAPLMLVGVVKLAPSLPVDGNFPFVHLERKFMHLGFHIYDVGFQSPNVEAARPLVYATALLLVVVIVALNLTAIMVRNRLREKYRALEH